MLNTIVVSAFGFFFWMIAARFYTETDVGFAAATISMLSLIVFLSVIGLDASLIRFLPQANKPQDLINSCFTLSGLISMVVACISIAGLNLWSPALIFIRQDPVFSAAFVAFAVMSTLSALLDYTFIARRRADFTLAKNAVFSLTKLPLPALLVLFFHSFGIVASWGIAFGLAVAVSLFFFLPKVQNSYKPVPALNLSLIKGMWQYSGGNYLASLLTTAPTTVLPIMVVNLLGPVQNAYFYIAWMIATFLFTIPLSVSQSLFAEGSHFEDKLRENVMKSVKFTFLLLVPTIILLVLVGKWILLAFGMSYSANALHLLWILAISSLPLGITFIYSTILRVTSRVKELVAIWGVIATATLVVSYLVMPLTGIIGIGYTWVGVQGAVAIYMLITRRLCRI